MTTTLGLMGKLGRMRAPELAIHPERCVEVRNRNAACGLCARVCASGAIRVIDNDFQIDPERCIGCGTCASACPTQAIEALRPNDVQLTNLMRCTGSREDMKVAGSEKTTRCGDDAREGGCGTDGACVVIACSEAIRACGTEPGNLHGVAEVVCLGRLDESIHAMAAAYGVDELILASNGCTSCKHAKAGAHAARVTAASRELLEALGSPMVVSVVDRIPAGCLEPGNTRPTHLLGQDAGLSRKDRGLAWEEDEPGIADPEDPGAAPASPDENPDLEMSKVSKRTGTLPQALPDRQTRLANCVRHLAAKAAAGEDADVRKATSSSAVLECAGSGNEAVHGTVHEDMAFSSRLWGGFSIDPQRCMSCLRCPVFCPTGALTSFDEVRDDRPYLGLDHRPALCVQCRTCEQTCPKGAITITGDIRLDDIARSVTHRIVLPPPEWTPNKPDSLYKKWRTLFNSPNMAQYG